MRSPNLFTMPGRSLSDLTPKEPVQKHGPFSAPLYALNNCTASDSVLSTLGRPKMGNGGSSGWIVSLTPVSSATGPIAAINAYRLLRSFLSSIDLYSFNASWNCSTVYPSSAPGRPEIGRAHV